MLFTSCASVLSYHYYDLRESHELLFSFQLFTCSLQPLWFYSIKQVPWDFCCLCFYSSSLALFSFLLILSHFDDYIIILCGSLGNQTRINIRLAFMYTGLPPPVYPNRLRVAVIRSGSGGEGNCVILNLPQKGKSFRLLSTWHSHLQRTFFLSTYLRQARGTTTQSGRESVVEATGGVSPCPAFLRAVPHAQKIGPLVSFFYQASPTWFLAIPDWTRDKYLI